MDQTGLGRMMYETPASDGSTCSAMAASLRSALAMQFDSVLGVHVKEMSREVINKKNNVTRDREEEQQQWCRLFR